MFDSWNVATILVWGGLALLFYAYAGYPLLLLLIGLIRRQPQAKLGYLPTISILIAAYNEEASIEKKVRQTLELDYPADKLEIIVLSDGSTDRTDEIVRAITDPRVRLFRAPQRKGKTNVQNLGVEIARGEILIFSDATTVYDPMALQYLACNFADPHVGAVSGRFHYFDQKGKSPTGVGTVAFWSYETQIKLMQSRISTISGCSGCIYAVRRSAYTPLRPEVISDLVQPLWAIQKGYRVVFEDRALGREETTRSSGEEFSMRVRVVTRGMRGILSVPALLNPFQYGWVSFQLISHKVLRWLVPVFMLMVLAGSGALWHQPFYRALFALQCAFYAFVLLTLVVPLHRIWKPLGIPLYFCTINAAAICSVLEVARGRKYIVWETVRS
jgi:cellulose synthase/poly-beta-1,6-N-acetylglucosamine synthase-like glycosyltransferase